MKPDFSRVFQGKEALRRQLAARPIAEKLQMLDALRARALAIRRASDSVRTPEVIVREDPPLSNP